MNCIKQELGEDFYQKLTCIKTLASHSLPWTHKILKIDELKE
jgi:hypothetical protein